MKTIVICGGNVGEYILDYAAPGDFIICADSGYDHAKKYGLAPDIVLGDMDSVKNSIDGENTRIYPTHKDFTDSEIAVQYAKERGYDELLLFGMIGTRMDHTLANLSLLKQVRDARIIDAHNEVFFAEGEITVAGKKGDTLSVLPFEGDLEGVTTEGLYYALDNAPVKSGTSLGVSNVMTADSCRITIKKGTAFVIKSRD